MAAATTVRKLVVEVVEARDLLPKDGTGTSSPYALADFGGQRRMTRTVARDLNPVWNEPLEFTFPVVAAGGREPLEMEVSVLHNLLVGPTRRSNFLGRVRLDARQFLVRKGEEAVIYFPLEKKSFLGWVSGDIGLKVYYVDEPVPVSPEPTPGADPPPNPAVPDAAEEVMPLNPDAAPASVDPPPVPTEEAEAPEAAPPTGEEASPEKPPEADAESQLLR